MPRYVAMMRDVYMRLRPGSGCWKIGRIGFEQPEGVRTEIKSFRTFSVQSVLSDAEEVNAIPFRPLILSAE